MDWFPISINAASTQGVIVQARIQVSNLAEGEQTGYL